MNMSQVRKASVATGLGATVGSFFVSAVIRILNIAPVQDILAANEELDPEDCEREEGEHEQKNNHLFAFTSRAL